MEKKTKKHEAGKGGTQRPLSVSRSTWDENYEKAFRKNKKKKKQ